MPNKVIQVQIASHIYTYMHIHIKAASLRGWIFNPTSPPSLCWWNGCRPNSRFSYQLLHSAFPTTRYQPQFCLVAQPFSEAFKGSQQAPLRAWELLINPGSLHENTFILRWLLVVNEESEATWTFTDFGWYAGTAWINKPTNTDKFFHHSLAYPVAAFISVILLMKKNSGQQYREFVVEW